MEFRLLYDGPLKAATQSNSRVKEKHAIRKELHKQLAELFILKSNDPKFQYLKTAVLPNEEVVPTNQSSDWPIRFEISDFHFVPLVARDFDLTCGLNILFLRRDSPGKVISGGDIDNRLKTLFDALSIPNRSQTVGTPESTESPFFCLLEDDSLITEVRVETDRLLTPLSANKNENDVVLVIGVEVKGWTELGTLIDL